MEVSYHLQARIVEDKGKIEEKSAFLGRFIIATNELNAEKLSSQEMLANYKEQKCVERGFRFLKDSSFMTSSFFLKKQERIIALGMVMCLCLLVYTIAQRQIRKRLKETGKTVPSQTGKPTQKPSLKWIFQIFEGVHVLLKKTNVQRIEIVLNLKPVHFYILATLGSSLEKIYAST